MCILLLVLGSINSKAQVAVSFQSDFNVIQDSRVLPLSGVGGFNAPQFQSMDLNLNGTEDLVIFDRSQQKLFTFLWDEDQYRYAPEYEYLFPQDLLDWVILADFNCNGRKDLFTASPFGMRVFENNLSNQGQLNFELIADPVFTQGFSGPINLQVNLTDIPSITDIDGDGDLDILVYNFAIGGFIELHRNQSIEINGSCGLDFVRETRTWGNFEECDCNSFAFDGLSCNELRTLETNAELHAGGKSLLAIDLNNSGLKDLLMGHELCDELYFLTNKGTDSEANFLSFENEFPKNKPANDELFPAPYFLDVDGDGIKDLIVATNLPNNINNRINFKNGIRKYINIGTNELPEFRWKEKGFLQNDMLDLGENSKPTFFQFEGEEYLLIGDRGNHQANDQFYASLTLLKKEAEGYRLVNNDISNVSQKQWSNLRPRILEHNEDQFLFLMASTNPSGNTNSLYIAQGTVLNEKPAEFESLAISTSIGDDFALIKDPSSDAVFLFLARANGQLDLYELVRSGESFSIETVAEAFLDIRQNFSFRNPSVEVFNDEEGIHLIYAGGDLSPLIYRNIFQPSDSVPDTLYFANDNRQILGNWRTGRNLAFAINQNANDNVRELFVGSRGGGLSQYLLITDASQLPPKNVPPFVAKAYPNPFFNELYIEVNQTSQAQLYNTLGQQLSSVIKLEKDKKNSLQMIDLPQGIYILKFLNQNKSIRLIKRN
ncbi:MAG: T9SS type A sorting domain-containing protein [Cyclobacteriaceae bacterium]|nr:T9SS type A sorting domain-containing protein [Cyclobacteriaceae bacterium]MCH8515783.1 T9SS type A sorting domain-containing protein [Cyclobacteriaceae bacterium]